MTKQVNTGGRPRIAAGHESRMIGFRADTGTMKRVNKACKRLNLKQSEIIRASLLSWLEAFEKSAPPISES